MECLNCKVTTMNPKFCSTTCAASYNNTLSPKRKPKVRNCTICNKEFAIAKRRRCQECQDAGRFRISQSFHRQKKIQYDQNFYKLLTIADYKNRPSNKNRHPLWAHNAIRGFCRSWNKNMQSMPCKRCGYSLHVELAHIKPMADFPETATLGEVNAPENIIPLCPNCHWEFDNGGFEGS